VCVCVCVCVGGVIKARVAFMLRWASLFFLLFLAFYSPSLFLFMPYHTAGCETGVFFFFFVIRKTLQAIFGCRSVMRHEVWSPAVRLATCLSTTLISTPLISTLLHISHATFYIGTGFNWMEIMSCVCAFSVDIFLQDVGLQDQCWVRKGRLVPLRSLWHCVFLLTYNYCV